MAFPLFIRHTELMNANLGFYQQLFPSISHTESELSSESRLLVCLKRLYAEGHKTDSVHQCATSSFDEFTWSPTNVYNVDDIMMVNVVYYMML